jgi:hypothetical protein
MSAQVAADLRAGDVITYEPVSRWCFDGWAIAEARDDRVILVDTYWISSGHVVTPESYQVEFNLDDYDEVRYRSEWEKYAEADRRRIPRHSGYQTILLVRKGAKPDLQTQIENASERVSDAESSVRSAQWSLELARQELAALRAAADRAEAEQ